MSCMLSSHRRHISSTRVTCDMNNIFQQNRLHTKKRERELYKLFISQKHFLLGMQHLIILCKLFKYSVKVNELLKTVSLFLEVCTKEIIFECKIGNFPRNN